MLDIHQVLVMQDNYVYLLRDPATGATAVVDPAEAEPVLAALARTGWKLSHILNTHHHWDHVDGNLALKQATGCQVYGAARDRGDIPGLDVALGEGDTVELGAITAQVMAVPGHTQGHLAYWFEADRALFCGDTLFAMGCGRLLGGTAEQMWNSLSRIRDLPDETRVYCAHEYTEANGRFALTLEPDNPALVERMARVRELRRDGRPTVPSLLREERATNPFLRPESPEIQATLGVRGAEPVRVFAETRRRKDAFR
ncbi:hydroxyacylglutathione hydrolase [Methylomagnum ishizawai]|uniref:hydroxyacylglutathione hydrolase n=1 Tax=Methylomagnum ishizawai TaxID=1760988 RepID=UPI001C337BA0|nr:hydroxyacylglutathione hydrolase [Methylomagnum ishizawai]BBL75892.1 hydroxyacylglutathione hydrolase [Methylomagnum ishizawai]